MVMDYRVGLSRREFLAITMSGTISGCFEPPYWAGEDLHSTESLPIVIIGSGATGLCLAGLLARIGHSVVVLESHPSLVGGHARILEVGGLEFSAGPQYLWNFGQDEIGSRVLRYLGDASQVPLDSMDVDGFENIITDGAEPFAVPLGSDRWKNALISRNLDAEHSIELFFEIFGGLLDGLRLIYKRGLYLQGFVEMWQAVLSSSEISEQSKGIVFRFANFTLGQVFDWCRMPDSVRRLLYGHAGIFAENVDAISLGVYVAATGFLHEGACFPKNGFGSLVRYLGDAIEVHGGEIQLNRRVSRLRVESNRVREVQCDDGTAIPCSFVVSTLSPGLTCALFDEVPKCVLRDYEPSRSLTSFFFTVNDYAEIEARLARRNYWYFAADSEIDFSPIDISQPPTHLYIGSNTANSPVLASGTPELSGLTVFSPGSFSAYERAFSVGESYYEDVKGQAARSVIEILERLLFPNVGEHLREMMVLSPYDLQLELASEQGSVYGRRLTPQSVLRSATPRFAVENVAIGCATVGLPGVSVCFQTASLMFEALTGYRVP